MRLRTQDQAIDGTLVEARDFQHFYYNIHKSGRKYSPSTLCSLFEAVLSNKHVEVASLHEALSYNHRGPVDAAVRAFADALPGSNLIAANIGEYRAHPSTWDHLIAKARLSILGHIYISETKLSLLGEQQKKTLRAVLRENREKRKYISIVLMPGRIKQIAAIRPWWAPPDTAEWYNAQLPKID